MVVGFVLSGGGNRGAMQVGALHALLERGIEPDILVGTSAGALNAAYLAAHPGLQGVAELGEVWARVAKADVYSGGRVSALWRLARGRESLYPNANLRRFIESHVPDGVRRFGDIRGAQLYIVAARLETGELRLFGDNPDELILDALMSSTAIPPFWPPWRCQDGELCIDGGVVADLPVGVALEKGAREIYALHTTAGPEEPHVPDNAWEISQQAITAMLRRQREVELQRVAQERDVRLHYIQLVPPEELPLWDFSHAAELIEAGYRQTVASLEAEALEGKGAEGQRGRGVEGRRRISLRFPTPQLAGTMARLVNRLDHLADLSRFATLITKEVQ